MQIQSVNNTNKTPMFTGNVYLKGNWPVRLKKAFTESPYTKELASGENDVIAKIVKHKVSYKEGMRSIEHSYGDVLYKIKIGLVESGLKSWLARNLGMYKGKGLTKGMYYEDDVIYRLDQQHFKRFF